MGVPERDCKKVKKESEKTATVFSVHKIPALSLAERERNGRL